MGRKIDEKGFMLVETLIVCVFVGVTLVFLFIELRSITNSYERSFTYNTTNALYNTRKIKEYIQTMDKKNMEEDVKKSEKGYIDITSCTSPYYNPVAGDPSFQAYCNLFYEKLKVNKIIFSKEDLTGVQTKMEENRKEDAISQKMLDFMDYIPYEKKTGFYRISVEYRDGTFASMEVKGSDNG